MTDVAQVTDDATTIKREVAEIVRQARMDRGNLLPILQQVQVKFGFLPRAAMQELARLLAMPAVDVYGVATFYNQFRLHPPGKHSVKVCLGTACHMKGGYVTVEAWERRLGIQRGETTSDREFDLDTVACVGCCAMAPVVVVDDDVQAKVTPTKVDGILLSLKRGRA